MLKEKVNLLIMEKLKSFEFDGDLEVLNYFESDKETAKKAL